MQRVKGRRRQLLRPEKLMAQSVSLSVSIGGTVKAVPRATTLLLAGARQRLAGKPSSYCEPCPSVPKAVNELYFVRAARSLGERLGKLTLKLCLPRYST
jgi:hypothetical protein